MNKTLTNEMARKLKSYVLPIYDQDNYVLYMFEAIGREMESLSQSVEKLNGQYYPQFATWTLKYWEDLLGLPNDRSLNQQERRDRVILELQTYYPINQQRMAIIASSAAGVKAEVMNNIEPCTFQLILEKEIEQVNFIRLIEEVDRVKPAHLNFILTPTITESLQITDKIFIEQRQYYTVKEFRVGMKFIKNFTEIQL